jgi:hypothetical protein
VMPACLVEYRKTSMCSFEREFTAKVVGAGQKVQNKCENLRMADFVVLNTPRLPSGITEEEPSRNRTTIWLAIGSVVFIGLGWVVLRRKRLCGSVPFLASLNMNPLFPPRIPVLGKSPHPIGYCYPLAASAISEALAGSKSTSPYDWGRFRFFNSVGGHSIERLNQYLCIEVSVDTYNLAPTHPNHMHPRVHIVFSVSGSRAISPFNDDSGIPRTAGCRD